MISKGHKSIPACSLVSVSRQFTTGFHLHEYILLYIYLDWNEPEIFHCDLKVISHITTGYIVLFCNCGFMHSRRRTKHILPSTSMTRDLLLSTTYITHDCFKVHTLNISVWRGLN